jgi:plastocyanin
MANCLSAVFLILSGLIMTSPVYAVTLSGQVHSDGKPLPDVVVTLKPVSHEPRLSATAGKPVSWRLDQKGKEFIPHILVIPPGTAVYFPNSDDIQHHVYSFSKAKRFEIKLYKGMPAEPIVFDQPGLVALGCNIHDWMLGYILITETPYFTQTNAEGHWSIDVPAGDYQVSLWHPDALAPDTLPNEIKQIQTAQTLRHSIDLKAWRASGKPPDTLQMQGYIE